MDDGEEERYTGEDNPGKAALEAAVPVSARISILLQKEKKIPIQVANLC